MEKYNELCSPLHDSGVKIGGFYINRDFKLFSIKLFRRSIACLQYNVGNVGNAAVLKHFLSLYISSLQLCG